MTFTSHAGLKNVAQKIDSVAVLSADSGRRILLGFGLLCFCCGAPGPLRQNYSGQKLVLDFDRASVVKGSNNW